ncbi:conserved hypothetical protein [Hyella patelloides LEGE 07179]|uniref:Uncharacterized protein n=1 Tax=Hyella patelloides LEGE 07179 TaxID=945734 RepID=A0A563VV88_9CYAN|nr:hypothetical protein [Hyella patelloides]VEP15317.1 conserved hypothetical protein [Hyella patelloides LEGE 07179]
MKKFGDCETINKNPNIVISDPGSKNNKSKFRLDNPKKLKIRVIQVDDCVITQGTRCDYLIILPNSLEIYIELKGKDVKHAIEQIEASIKQLTASLSAKKSCFIASTRCPLTSPQIQKFKK